MAFFLSHGISFISLCLCELFFSEELCESLINTEFLAKIYRALGARIGQRVQIDSLHGS